MIAEEMTEQPAQQLTPAELRERRRQKVLAQQQDRMALVTNTTVERVEMPEEYYRHQEFYKQIQLAEQKQQDSALKAQADISFSRTRWVVLKMANLLFTIAASLLCFGRCLPFVNYMASPINDRIGLMNIEVLLFSLWAFIFVLTLRKYGFSKGALEHAISQLRSHFKASAVVVACVSVLCE